MNWRNFSIALLFGVILSIALVFVFERWPHLSESPWTMLALFIFALICSRLMRRFIRK